MCRKVYVCLCNATHTKKGKSLQNLKRIHRLSPVFSSPRKASLAQVMVLLPKAATRNQDSLIQGLCKHRAMLGMSQMNQRFTEDLVFPPTEL